MAEKKKRRNSEFKQAKEVFIDLIIYLLYLLTSELRTFFYVDPYSYTYFVCLGRFLFSSKAQTSSQTSVKMMDIGTHEIYWKYLETEILPKLLEEKDYLLKDSILLGPPRLRQVRVHSKPCNSPTVFRKFFNECYPAYSSQNEVTTTYKGVKYQDWNQIVGLSFQGSDATYNGGGFVVQLDRDLQKSKAIVAELSRNHWIDSGTRLVLFEASLYNNNAKMFAWIQLALECLSSGGAKVVPLIRTVPIYTVWTYPKNYFMWIVSSIFLFSHVYYSYLILRNVGNIGILASLTNFWTPIDFIVTGFLWQCALYDIWHIFYTDLLEIQFQQHPDETLSLDVLCFAFYIFLHLMAVCQFGMNIGILKYLVLNKTLMQFASTIRKCWSELFGFSLMFGVVFFAYVLLGYLWFGSQHETFHNYRIATLTMMRLMIGEFNHSFVQDSLPYLGPIYFISYILLIFFILVHVLLAIISGTYINVKNDIRYGQLHMADFLTNLLSKCFKSVFCCFFRWRFPKNKQILEKTDSLSLDALVPRHVTRRSSVSQPTILEYDIDLLRIPPDVEYPDLEKKLDAHVDQIARLQEVLTSVSDLYFKLDNDIEALQNKIQHKPKMS